jgi:hypothetical protein
MPKVVAMIIYFPSVPLRRPSTLLPTYDVLRQIPLIIVRKRVDAVGRLDDPYSVAITPVSAQMSLGAFLQVGCHGRIQPLPLYTIEQALSSETLNPSYLGWQPALDQERAKRPNWCLGAMVYIEAHVASVLSSMRDLGPHTGRVAAAGDTAEVESFFPPQHNALDGGAWDEQGDRDTSGGGSSEPHSG